jgi:hypothetical protein
MTLLYLGAERNTPERFTKFRERQIRRNIGRWYGRRGYRKVRRLR